MSADMNSLQFIGYDELIVVGCLQLISTVELYCGDIQIYITTQL